MPASTSAGSPVRRRLLLGLVGVLVAAALAGLVARLVRPAGHPAAAPRTPPASTAAAAPSPSATNASAGAGAVVGPPRTTDPVVFGKAFARALWSYDTRRTTQAAYLASLERWLTSESQYADASSVVAQVPDASLWAELRAQGQYATARVTEGHIPSAFAQELSQDPGAITTAYIYAVTVTGSQSITWNGGGSGAEDRITTLAVQCRPGHWCALASIATTAAP